MAAAGAALAGLLGAFLGWFNVTILFPRKVVTTAQVEAPAGTEPVVAVPDTPELLHGSDLPPPPVETVPHTSTIRPEVKS